MSLSVAFDARKALDFGIGRYVCGLLAGLARLAERDRSLALVALGPPEARERIGDLLGGGLPHLRWIDESTPGYSVRELWSLSQLARRERIDLFHAPHYVLPLGLRCKRVVTVHDLNHLRHPEFLRHPIGVLYADRMLRRALRADRVLVVSEATRSDLRLAFGVRGDRIRVIRNGIDDRFFGLAEPAADRAALAGLGLESGYLLFVGNPKPHKNLEGLLRALSRTTNTTARLVVAGGREANRDGGLGALADRLGVAGRVRWLGFVDDEVLPALYRGAQALVLPSRAEGFGLPVAEAMACGTATVVSSVPALVELVGDAGWVIDLANPDELTRALDGISSDAALRKRLGENGRRRAAELHWEATARATWDTYQEVLREPCGPSVPTDSPEPGGFPRDVFAFGRGA